MLENADYGSIGDLGEFKLIEELTKAIEIKQSSTVKGIGDDAAVIDAKGKQIVVSTDMLMEGVHFDLSYSPLKHLGYKAITINLSDIYAMNAEPTQVLVSMALSSKFTLEAVEALYSGMRLACDTYGVDLVGGDTTSSRTGLALSITAMGVVEPSKISYRSGAKENDLIVVSGDLGGAYMGLQVLEREKQVFQAASTVQPDLEGYDYILERQLKPEPRADMIRLFEELKITPTAMIDVSDGLASELLHLAKASNCGVTIYENKLPLDPVTIRAIEEFKMDPNTVALNGGEDYELLFTIPQSDFEKIEFREDMHVIGHVTANQTGNYMVTTSGSQLELKAQGWNHFRD